MIQVHGVSARRLCDCQYKIEWINLHAYRSLSLGALKCLYNKYIRSTYLFQEWNIYLRLHGCKASLHYKFKPSPQTYRN